MRKQDYGLLATLIKGFLSDDSVAAKTPIARAPVILIAMTFAGRAHVDKKAFLKACGIE